MPGIESRKGCETVTTRDEKIKALRAWADGERDGKTAAPAEDKPAPKRTPRKGATPTPTPDTGE